MFRRRAMLRPVRRALAGEVPPLLRRANDLMASGNYLEAGQLFEQLAHGAQARGLPRDAQLFLQAGRCRVLAGQVPAGMTHLKQGLSLLAGRGQALQVQNAGVRILSELRQRGLVSEAAEMETHLQSLQAGFPGTGSTANPARAPLLPTVCPGCGGPLRPDEVEWLDEFTAECPYCGSAVRAE